MYAANDLKYTPNLFDVHVTVKVWNAFAFFTVLNIILW